MYYCTECGRPVDEDAVFCPICGTKTDVELDAINNMASSPESEMTGLKSNQKEIKQEENIGVGTSDDMPIFEPPKEQFESGVGDDIVTFTPPAFTGSSCFYHHDEPSVSNCTRCGKNLCRDCFDAYRVEAGEYAGQAICYDCSSELVAENIELLKKQKSQIMTSFIMTGVGFFIGFILFIAAGILMALIGGLWFGSFWFCIKNTVTKWIANPYAQGIWGLIGTLAGTLIIAPFKTIAKIINCIKYLNDTTKYIEEDTAALQQMRDYMEYTLVRSQYSSDFDLDSMMNEGSTLYNNSYAREVQEHGEDAADAMLRQGTTTIAANGEIIRNFAA